MCNGCYYRPQTKFAKVMFLQVSVCPHGGVRGRGVCMVGGACMVGVCMLGGHAWWGVCMAGGMHGGGVHCRGACVACMPPPPRTDTTATVNDRAVRILLECILVTLSFYYRDEHMVDVLSTLWEFFTEVLI